MLKVPGEQSVELSGGFPACERIHNNYLPIKRQTP